MQLSDLKHRANELTDYFMGTEHLGYRNTMILIAVDLAYEEEGFIFIPHSALEKLVLSYEELDNKLKGFEELKNSLKNNNTINYTEENNNDK